MASRRPRRDTPSVYGRDRLPLRGDRSSSGAAPAGGDERTSGNRHRRQRSPPSPRDVVLEEHVAATNTSSSDDEGGQQTSEGEGGGTATRKLYERGPAQLPSFPLPDRCPVIRPMAKRAWLVLSGTAPRTPASILGVLCRKFYPGIVQLSSDPVVREPASNWDRYALATDDEQRNKQERVLAEFWKFFKAEEGLENQADQAAHAACRKYVTEMHHHGRVQAHIEYHRSVHKRVLTKPEARRITLTRDQYLLVIPWWCRSFPECWAMIVDKWLSEGYVEMHGKQRENRLVRQGPTHHQGSRSLPAYKQALEAKHPGEELLDFSAWAMSHIGRSSSSISFDPSLPPETYSDPNVYTKVQEYTSAVREIHGEDYDVRTEPIDAEAIMRL